ncbi:hypothetical protein BX600DRAFT_46285 [Xylariales sp. PMI_506]|nr:hypothetical protein BX600DRAFT_46285 [Xylariales sp. PMI_506]
MLANGMCLDIGSKGGIDPRPGLVEELVPSISKNLRHTFLQNSVLSLEVDALGLSVRMTRLDEICARPGCGEENASIHARQAGPDASGHIRTYYTWAMPSTETARRAEWLEGARHACAWPPRAHPRLHITGADCFTHARCCSTGFWRWIFGT